MSNLLGTQIVTYRWAKGPEVILSSSADVLPAEFEAKSIKARLTEFGAYAHTWNPSATTAVDNIGESLDYFGCEAKKFAARLRFYGDRYDRARNIQTFNELSYRDISAKTPGALRVYTYSTDRSGESTVCTELEAYIVATEHVPPEKGAHTEMTLSFYAPRGIWFRKHTYSRENISEGYRFINFGMLRNAVPVLTMYLTPGTEITDTCGMDFIGFVFDDAQLVEQIVARYRFTEAGSDDPAKIVIDGLNHEVYCQDIHGIKTNIFRLRVPAPGYSYDTLTLFDPYTTLDNHALLGNIQLDVDKVDAFDLNLYEPTTMPSYFDLNTLGGFVET